MSRSNYDHDETVIYVKPTYPHNPSVGEPCMFGLLPGVCVSKPDVDGRVRMFTRGVFRLPVNAPKVRDTDLVFYSSSRDVLTLDEDDDAFLFGIVVDQRERDEYGVVLVFVKGDLG